MPRIYPKLIAFRATSEFVNAARQKAEEEGVSFSEFIRCAVESAVRPAPREERPPSPSKGRQAAQL